MGGMPGWQEGAGRKDARPWQRGGGSLNDPAWLRSCEGKASRGVCFGVVMQSEFSLIFI